MPSLHAILRGSIPDQRAALNLSEAHTQAYMLFYFAASPTNLLDGGGVGGSFR